MISHVPKATKFITGITAISILMVSTSWLTLAAPDQPYENAHAVVQKTKDDLDRVINQDPEIDKGRAQARIDSAKQLLTKFDRALSDNKFDKRLLNSAIAGVKEVLSGVPTGAKERDALKSDLYDISHLRAAPGK